MKFKQLLTIMMVLLMVSCTASEETNDTDVQTTSSDQVQASTGNAVASMFSSSEPSMSALVSGVQSYLESNSDGIKTCDWMQSGNDEEIGIIITGEVESGTYGSEASPLTIDKEEGCTVDGEDNPEGVYASFQGEEHILTCTDQDGNEFDVLLEDFTGVYKDELEGETSYTSIYGSFAVTPMQNGDAIQQQTLEADCSLTVTGGDENGGGIIGGDCTDAETGDVLADDEDINCVESDANYDDSDS